MASSRITTQEKRDFLRKMESLPPEEILWRDLLVLLRDENSLFRNLAFNCLTKCKNPGMLPALVDQLSKVDMEMRIQLIMLLGELREPSAAPVLTRYLTDPRTRVRQATALALTNFGNEAISAVVKEFSTCSTQAKVYMVQAFSGFVIGGEEVLALALEEEESWIRREAVHALTKKRSSEAIQLLIKALDDSFPLIRLEALQSLSNQKDPFLSHKFHLMMKDPSPHVAAAAASALEKQKATILRQAA